MAYRSIFNPKNIKKYAGDPAKIVCRSMWERNVCKFCDDHPSILKWSSEEIAIPYINPIDKKVHTYFPDFLIQFKTTTKNIIIFTVKGQIRNRKFRSGSGHGNIMQLPPRI